MKLLNSVLVLGDQSSDFYFDLFLMSYLKKKKGGGKIMKIYILLMGNCVKLITNNILNI
jgi:hypothetical protein